MNIPPHEHPARPDILSPEVQLRLNDQLGLDSGLDEQSQVVEAQLQHIHTGQELFRRNGVAYDLGSYSEDQISRIVDDLDQQILQNNLTWEQQMQIGNLVGTAKTRKGDEESRLAALQQLSRLAGGGAAQLAEQKIREEQADAAEEERKRGTGIKNGLKIRV